MDILTDYLGEFILIIGIAFLKLIGKNESAEKLIKKRNKLKKKLRKRLDKESKCVERDLEKLKELEKED